VISAGVVVWADNLAGLVEACPTGACPGPTALDMTMGANQTGLAADGSNAYWCEAAKGDILKCSLGGCPAPTKVVSGIGCYHVATDGTNVYWVDATSVKKCDVSGCSQPTTLAKGLTSPWGIAVAGNSVFVTDLMAGTVLRMPK
jgi:hypothetical protein